MIMPDCRLDQTYNEDYLNEDGKDYLEGFDFCIEQAVDVFFNNNLGGLADDASYLGHLLNERVPESMKSCYEMEYASDDKENEVRQVETYADLIRMRLLEYIESTRNELIVSMLESMPEEEYQKCMTKGQEKNKFRRHPKEYQDTRRWH